MNTSPYARPQALTCRRTYLLLICRMFPWTAHMIRYQLTESEVFPNLSLDITSMCLKDEVNIHSASQRQLILHLETD